MKVKLHPTIIAVAESDRKDRSLENYVNACVLRCHGDHPALQVLNELDNYLQKVIVATHATDRHEPEYIVIQAHLRKLREDKDV